jgi:hypothetical protein
MLVGFHLPEDRGDMTRSANEEGRPFRAHVFPAEKILFHPNTVSLHDLALWVRKQRKRQTKLSNEFLMTLRRIGAHPKYRRASFYVVPGVA